MTYQNCSGLYRVQRHQQTNRKAKQCEFHFWSDIVYKCRESLFPFDTVESTAKVNSNAGGFYTCCRPRRDTERERERWRRDTRDKAVAFYGKESENIGITTKKTPSPEANNFSLFESARASILINDWKNDKRTLYTARSWLGSRMRQKLVNEKKKVQRF